MRLLVAVLVLAAATGGFLLGRLTAPEQGGRGGQRHAAPAPMVPPAIAPESSAAQASVQHETATPAAVDETAGIAAAADEIVLPTHAGENTAWPQLDVDFEGFEGQRTAWIASRTITGGLVLEKFEAGDNGVAWCMPEPGVYEVWWFDSEGTRRGTRVRMEAGQVTRVRAADHGLAPLPKGLGAVKVELTALSGGVLADKTINVGRAGGYSSESATTDLRGQADIVVAPGRYFVSFVDHESEIVVEEGRTTFHRIVHGREGELVLVAEKDCRISIEPVGRDGFWYDSADFVGTEAVMPYLRAGEYDIVLSDLVPLGRVTIRAGQSSRFRCKVPSGGVAVSLVRPGHDKLGKASVSIRSVADGRETSRSVDRDEPTGQVTLTLPSGRYMVTASSEECEPATAEVDVADAVLPLTLQLRPR